MTDCTYLTADQVRERLRKACEEAGSQAKWSRDHGVAFQHVSLVLLGHVPPGGAITRAMGLKKVLTFTIDE